MGDILKVVNVWIQREVYSVTSLADEAGQGDGPPEALYVDLPALVTELETIHTGVRAFLEE